MNRAGLSQSAALFQLRIRVNLSSPSPPSLPLYSFPFSSPFPPPRHEAAPLNQVRGLEERCKVPQQGPGRALAAVAFCCIVFSQNASGCSISGSV